MDDIPTKFVAKFNKKRKREITPYNQNVAVKEGAAKTTLEPVCPCVR
jgi:hypothetical protein